MRRERQWFGRGLWRVLLNIICFGGHSLENSCHLLTVSSQQDMAKRGGLAGVGGSLFCLEQMGKVDRNFTHDRLCH